MHFILSSAATTTSPFLNAWLVGTLFALLVLLGFTSGFVVAQWVSYSLHPTSP